MKSQLHITANNETAKRMNYAHTRSRAAKSKPASGSVVGLIPVILDGGRTIIYVTDKARETEVRMKYALRL